MLLGNVDAKIESDDYQTKNLRIPLSLMRKKEGNKIF